MHGGMNDPKTLSVTHVLLLYTPRGTCTRIANCQYCHSEYCLSGSFLPARTIQRVSQHHHVRATGRVLENEVYFEITCSKSSVGRSKSYNSSNTNAKHKKKKKKKKKTREHKYNTHAHTQNRTASGNNNRPSSLSYTRSHTTTSHVCGIMGSAASIETSAAASSSSLSSGDSSPAAQAVLDVVRAFHGALLRLAQYATNGGQEQDFLKSHARADLGTLLASFTPPHLDHKVVDVARDLGMNTLGKLLRLASGQEEEEEKEQAEEEEEEEMPPGPLRDFVPIALVPEVAKVIEASPILSRGAQHKFAAQPTTASAQDLRGVALNCPRSCEPSLWSGASWKTSPRHTMKSWTPPTPIFGLCTTLCGRGW